MVDAQDVEPANDMEFAGQSKHADTLVNVPYLLRGHVRQSDGAVRPKDGLYVAIGHGYIKLPDPVLGQYQPSGQGDIQVVW